MLLKSALVLSVLSLCSLARAEQFVLVDLSYTHSTDTTKDSHYYPKHAADTPKDWTKPVDYSHGSVHIVVDVKTKPAGDAPTKFQICFEGTPSYACTAQSPTYTKTGRVEWDSPFSGFWYESTVDWAQGIKQMPLILKDTMNNKPAGDPKYMPTDLHVQVTLVSPGASFVPPPAAGSGGAAAGAAGAAGMPAGGAGAAGARAGAGAAGSPAAGRGAAGRDAAGRGAAGGGGAAGSTPSTPAPAGSSGNAGAGSTATAGSGANAGAQAAAGSDEPTTASDSGCRSSGSGNHGAWQLGLWLACLATRGRRRLRHSSFKST